MDYVFDIVLDHMDDFIDQIIASTFGYVVFFSAAVLAKIF